MARKPNTQYLGDGVYASFDGFHIILDLRGQDNTTQIALDPQVVENFIAYQDSVYPIPEPKQEGKEWKKKI